MQKANGLAERSFQATDQTGFKESTADNKAWWAVLQAEVGNATKARELATASFSISHGRGNLSAVALALAMTGDGARAESVIGDLGHRFPDDTLLHSVYIPAVNACVAMNRKKPEEAITDLESATPYQYGGYVGMLPNYFGDSPICRRSRGRPRLPNSKRSSNVGESIRQTPCTRWRR